jgi:hypothetical protein
MKRYLFAGRDDGAVALEAVELQELGGEGKSLGQLDEASSLDASRSGLSAGVRAVLFV